VPSTDSTPASSACGRRPGSGRRSAAASPSSPTPGDVVRIGVRFPDAKGWWRNFTGDGVPLTVQLDGVDRPGHGLAHRDAKGRVTVTVRL
jgi:hypothetical protein